MAKKETRTYPTSCQSMYCGALSCDDCSKKPQLDEFKHWRQEHKAVQPDRVWSPSVWQATC